MKNNITNLDRVIRITIALFIAFLIFGGSVSGGLGIFLSIIGGFFFLTGVAGECPVYGLFGINTNPDHQVKGTH